MSERQAPAYPGYRAEACNGCGLCCLTVPCVVSSRLGLWRDGVGCRALSFEAGRYWCDVIRAPERVSTRIRKMPRHTRRALTGTLETAPRGCDFRAAWSLSDVFRLLMGPAIIGGASDWPRPCVYYHPDGSTYYVQLDGPDAEPWLQRITHAGGGPAEFLDSPIPLSRWSPP